MANRIMHQTNATVTQTFSALPTGFHQIPFGETNPVCMTPPFLSPSMGLPRLDDLCAARRTYGSFAGGRDKISHRPQPVKKTNMMIMPAANSRNGLSYRR
jgi:hypothetical protein